MTRNLFALLAIALLAIGLAACRPGVPLGAPGSAFTHDDGYVAIELGFARFGPEIVACAHGVAARESNHWPYAGFGRKYKGMLQMHDGFQGSYDRAAAEMGGRFASPFDPYVQAFAASYAFEAAGGSFRANWPTTTPAGCP